VLVPSDLLRLRYNTVLPGVPVTCLFVCMQTSVATEDLPHFCIHKLRMNPQNAVKNKIIQQEITGPLSSVY
jgi:hypothetical protein